MAKADKYLFCKLFVDHSVAFSNFFCQNVVLPTHKRHFFGTFLPTFLRKHFKMKSWFVFCSKSNYFFWNISQYPFCLFSHCSCLQDRFLLVCICKAVIQNPPQQIYTSPHHEYTYTHSPTQYIPVTSFSVRILTLHFV